MGDLHKLPDVKQAEREASEWIARLQADDVTADDQAAFETWRAVHPAHAQAYERLMNTWQQFVAAGPFVRAVEFARSVSAPVEQPRRRWALAAAAASLFAVLLAALHVARTPATDVFATAVGEQMTLSLSDGSKLQLNSDSVVRVDYSPQSRVISLEKGEAFFNVAHDPRRPFWVAGGKSWVRAVGTAFNVHVRPAGVQVIVSEGVVKVGYVQARSGGGPSDAVLAKVPTSILTAGHVADVRASSTSTRQLSADELLRQVAWRSGTIHFENQPLGDVIDEVGRYTTLRMTVDEADLRRLTVGGTFQANPNGAEALLAMLEQGFGLSVRRDGDRVYIEQGAGQ